MSKQKKLTAQELALLRQYDWGGALEGLAYGAVSGATAGTAVVPGWGTLAGAVIGGVVGAIGGDAQGDAEIEYKDQKARAEAKQKANTEFWMNPESTSTGNWHAPQYATGGQMNGGLQQDIVQEYKGQSHQGPQEGIPVDEGGRPSVVSGNDPIALVEGNEVQWNGYVFSDKLKADDGKKFSEKARKILNKYKKRLGENLEHDDEMASESLNRELDNLANANEMKRLAKENGKKFEEGGQLTPEDYIEPGNYKQVDMPKTNLADQGYNYIDSKYGCGGKISKKSSGGQLLGSGLQAVGSFVDMGSQYSNAVSQLEMGKYDLYNKMDAQNLAQRQFLIEQGIGYYPTKSYADGGMIEGDGPSTLTPEEEGELLGIGPPPELNGTMQLLDDVQGIFELGGPISGKKKLTPMEQWELNNKIMKSPLDASIDRTMGNAPNLFTGWGSPKPRSEHNYDFMTQQAFDARERMTTKDKIGDPFNTGDYFESGTGAASRRSNTLDEVTVTPGSAANTLDDVVVTPGTGTIASARSAFNETLPVTDDLDKNMAALDSTLPEFVPSYRFKQQIEPDAYKRDWFAYAPAVANITRGVFGEADYTDPAAYQIEGGVRARTMRTDELERAARANTYNKLRAYNPADPAARQAQIVSNNALEQQEIAKIKERAFNVNEQLRQQADAQNLAIQEKNLRSRAAIDEMNKMNQAAKDQLITTGLGQLTETYGQQEKAKNQYEWLNAMNPRYETIVPRGDGSSSGTQDVGTSDNVDTNIAAGVSQTGTYTNPTTGETKSLENMTETEQLAALREMHPWLNEVEDENVLRVISEPGTDVFNLKPGEGLPPGLAKIRAEQEAKNLRSQEDSVIGNTDTEFAAATSNEDEDVEDFGTVFDLDTYIGSAGNAESSKGYEQGKTELLDDNGDERSSAEGKYQMLDSTWEQYVQKAFPETTTMSPAQRKALKTGIENKKYQDGAMREFTKDNIKGLKASDIPVNNSTVYSAHVLGLGGARRLHKGYVEDPTAPCNKYMSEKGFDNNREMFTDANGDPLSVAEAYMVMDKRTK